MNEPSPDSEYLYKTSCDNCGSSDANAVYSDGHSYCFSCQRYTKGEGEISEINERKQQTKGSLLPGRVPEGGLRKRGLTEETCRKWSYLVGRTSSGVPVQIAQYRDASGQIVAQKLRTPDKEMPWTGDKQARKQVQLYGAHLWGPSKKIVVTEGEIDAMTVSQVQNHKWPVVSLINGASGAKRDLLRNLEYLRNFGEVILMFDQDEAGREGAEEAAKALLGSVPVKIATLDLKDANEMLLAGRGDEIISAIWNATPYKPSGVMTLGDIKEEMRKPIEWGLPWAFEELTKLTYGRHPGIYALGAGTGVGKTDILTQQVAYDITELKEKVGVFFLEQQPAETGRRIAGKVAGKRFHIPDAGWTQEELEATVDALAKDDRLFLYDHYGHIDWDTIASTIRFLAGSEGVRIFYLDHLTALADPSNERESLETIMAEMASIVQELGLVLILVSHLATPEGKPHEEGGRVTIRHFKGSRAIGFWSSFMFGLERNQQAEDEDERSTTTFRVLKDRYTGNSTGATLRLRYDRETGMLSVVPEEDTNPFNNTDEDEEF